MLIVWVSIFFSNATQATPVLEGRNVSFTCSYPDIPVFWDFEPAAVKSHQTLAYLDTTGRMYVDSSSKHRLLR